MPFLRKIIKEISLIAAFCFFTFSLSHSQTSSIGCTFNVTIEGVVVDSITGAKLSNVTIAVQEIKNNRVFKNWFTNEKGFFEITNLPNKYFWITLSYIGYKATTIQLPSSTSSPIHLGQIPLVSLTKQLEEVKVTTPKPVLEQNADKITYNVDADPESKIATALDILRKIPLLTIDADDNLQLNGTSNYRVLINGKSSSLFLRNHNDLFKNLSASAIKTIEVMTVPPSRFAAEGVGGVINITTYKKNISGYNGGINFRYSSPKGYSSSADVTTSVGKISFSGNIGYNSSSSPTNSSQFTRQDKLRQNRLEQVRTGNNKNWSQNFGGEISYELNSLNLLTASYSMNNYNGFNNLMQHVALFDDRGDLAEAYNNQNTGKSKSYGNDFGFDYQHSFKNNDEQQFTLSYKSSNNTNRSNTGFILQPLINYKDKSSITANDDKSLEQNVHADYVQPIKKHTLELGVSAVFRQNNSDYFYKNHDTITSGFVTDTSLSNNFNYREDIYAGYTSLNLKMGKWGLRMGCRLEQAKVYAHFISSGTTAIQNYLNFIPSITLSRPLKGVSIISLSYTERIERPNIYYVNPYVDIIDYWNISYGNPALRSALAHVFNLSYTTYIKKTSLNINVFHQCTNNSIQQFTTLDADTISRTTYGNIGKNKNLSFSMAGNTTLVKNLGINLNTTSNYVQYTSIINGTPHNNEGFTYNISSSANLHLKSWRLASSMSYNSPNIFLQGRSASYISNSITINKYFFKNNKVNVSLAVNSPFRKHRLSSIEINDPTFYQMRKSSVVIRRLNISFNYRFSKL